MSQTHLDETAELMYRFLPPSLVLGNVYSAFLYVLKSRKIKELDEFKKARLSKYFLKNSVKSCGILFIYLIFKERLKLRFENQSEIALGTSSGFITGILVSSSKRQNRVQTGILFSVFGFFGECGLLVFNNLRKKVIYETETNNNSILNLNNKTSHIIFRNIIEKISTFVFLITPLTRLTDEENMHYLNTKLFELEEELETVDQKLKQIRNK